MQKYQRLIVLVCWGVWLVSGCGQEPSGVALAVDSKYIEDNLSIKMRVLAPLVDKKSGYCEQILSLKVKVEEKNFKTEKEKSFQLSREGTSAHNESFEKIEPGEKVFFVEGVGKDSTTPVLFGCQEGTVEAGKKLQLTILLIPYPSSTP